MSWHYQPVWGEDQIGEHVDRWYALCEVYLDEADQLKHWTADPAMEAIGADLDELCSTLAMMTSDAKRWKPVRFADLEVGMVLEQVEAA